MRTIRTPALGIEPNDVIPLPQGGLGSTTVAAAVTALNAYKTSEINAPYGLLGLSSGKASAAVFPGLSGVSIPMTGGAATLNGKASTTYTLQNYDVGTTYGIAITGNGTVSSLNVNGTTYAATFTYTAPAFRTNLAANNDGFVITATSGSTVTTRTIKVAVNDLNKVPFTAAGNVSSPISAATGSITFKKSDGTDVQISVLNGTVPFQKADGTMTTVALTT